MHLASSIARVAAQVRRLVGLIVQQLPRPMANWFESNEVLSSQDTMASSVEKRGREAGSRPPRAPVESVNNAIHNTLRFSTLN